MDPYQVCSTLANIKSFFFPEYGHVVKDNEAYKNMSANNFLLRLPLIPGVGSEVYFFSFLKVVTLHNQINNTIHANFLPFDTPLTPVWG